MIRKQKTGIVLLAALLITGMSSCNKSIVDPPAPTGESTEMKFAANASYKYRQAQLDTTGSTNPNGEVKEAPDPKPDTITSTVIETNASYKGKTGVTVVENVHTQPAGFRDTTWYYQENGNVYRYNFGVDLLNNIVILKAFLKDDQGNPQPLDVGWVLQARLRDTTVGSKWVTGNGEFTLNGVPVIGKVEGTLTDTAHYVGASTITVGGKAIRVKQYKHFVTLTSLTTVKCEIDTYVSASLGATVQTVAHSTRVAVPTFAPQQVQGFINTMFQSSVQ
jgi:hypothetical protein